MSGTILIRIKRKQQFQQMKIEIIESLFETKSYSEVVIVLNKNSEYLNGEISEAKAHHFAIAAFSYFHTGAYKNTIKYGRRLMQFIINNGDSEEADNLIRDLVVIVFDSYLKLGKRVAAYFFLKGHNRKIILRGDIVETQTKLRLEISMFIFVSIELLLVSISILVVLLQHIYHVWTTIEYLVLITILVALLLWFFYAKKKIQKIIFWSV